MYKKILVPLDGSKVAETILPYVRSIADDLKSYVELLGVTEPVLAGVHDYVQTNYHMSVEDVLLKQTEDGLKAASAYLSGTPGKVTTKIVNGIASEKIVEEAAMEPLTLIAMASHGRSGIGRWAMGSVADKVLHTTTSPMLIVKGSEEKFAPASVQFRSAIIPLDGSKVAEQALGTATALASAMKLKVILARVTPPAASYYQYAELPAINFVQFAEQVDKDAMTYLDTVEQKLKTDGIGQVDKLLLHGNPAGAIIDEAKKMSDSLVIMTTHGASGVKRALLGSVADKVVTESDRPVLLIRVSG